MGRVNAYACYRELGGHLRKLRAAAELTGTALAEELGWTTTRVSRIESGQIELDTVDLIRYLGALGIYGAAGDDLIELCRLAGRKIGYWLSPHGEWLQDSLTSLIFHEATADRCTTYEPRLVPGLLQTAEYARTRIAAEQWRSLKDVDECVRVRLERGQVLHVPNPGRFPFFIHEQALRFEVGGAAIMQEQMIKLVLLAGLSHVTVRVVPTSAGDQAAFGEQFQLFEYGDHRPLVYLDNHATGLFLEDREYVAPYRDLVTVLSKAALDEGQSRQMIATLASVYDRGSERDAGHSVEEEQL
jgi:transcriptional regulator with XRE-family HTH domain